MGEDLAGDFLRHTTTEHRLIADSSTHSAEPEIASPSAVESTTQEVTYKEQYTTLAKIIALSELKKYLDSLPTIESVLGWYEGRSGVQRVISVDHLVHLVENGEDLMTVYETSEEGEEGDGCIGDTLEEGEGEDECVGEKPKEDQDGWERGEGSSARVLARALIHSDWIGPDEEERRRREDSAREGALEFMLSWRSRLGGRIGLADKADAESATK
jgi:hypothetical protein